PGRWGLGRLHQQPPGAGRLPQGAALLTGTSSPRRPHWEPPVAAFTHSLDPLFRPQSVAVLGASVTPGSVGSILIRNLLANPFGGVVYPINPRRRSVHGVHCYPSLAALPEPVDLAVIATPAVTVPGLVRECADRGVKGVIVISAGFSELGAEGKALEGQVRAAAKGKLRLIGP